MGRNVLPLYNCIEVVSIIASFSSCQIYFFCVQKKRELIFQDEELACPARIIVRFAITAIIISINFFPSHDADPAQL